MPSMTLGLPLVLTFNRGSVDLQDNGMQFESLIGFQAQLYHILIPRPYFFDKSAYGSQVVIKQIIKEGTLLI